MFLRMLPLLDKKVDMERRFCLVCGSDIAEDEHQSVFDCPAYCSIRLIKCHYLGTIPDLIFFLYLTGP